MSELRIGLYGPYSSHNLGDTATQLAVMANLTRLAGEQIPEHKLEFIGIGSDPLDIAHTHRIPALYMTGAYRRAVWPDGTTTDTQVPVSRWRRIIPERILTWMNRIRQVWNIVCMTHHIDVLLISGGGQLDDFWGGGWGRPFELFVWTLACRVRGRRVIAFATAVDNLQTRFGAWLAFMAMRLSHYKVFRDQMTVDMLTRAGLSHPGHRCPDAAFSLPREYFPLRDEASDPGMKIPDAVILACPISERAWRHTADGSYQSYLNEFVLLCVELAVQGACVWLSNSQIKMDIPVAEAVASRVMAELHAHGASDAAQRVSLHHARTVAEYAALATQADIVIASRLHGVMLPLVAGTPVIAISYMPKVRQLMIDSELSQYCVELTAMRTAELLPLIAETLTGATVLRTAISDHCRQFRRQLEQEYTAILHLLTGGS